MPEIKPRIDDDGVPWCDAGCPQLNNVYYDVDELHHEGRCKIDGSARAECEVCPHAVRRMAVENEAFSCGRMYRAECLESGKISFWLRPKNLKSHYQRFDTIDAAVDALMEESNA